MSCCNGEEAGFLSTNRDSKCVQNSSQADCCSSEKPAQVNSTACCDQEESCGQLKQQPRNNEECCGEASCSSNGPPLPRLTSPKACDEGSTSKTEDCCGNGETCGVSKPQETDKCCGETTCSSDGPVQQAGPGACQATPSKNTGPCCDADEQNCCDDTCIDTLAERECSKVCGTPQEGGERTDAILPVVPSAANPTTGTKADGRSSKKSKLKACDYHAIKARKLHRPTLEALGCICRALLALNQDSCCTLKMNSGDRMTSKAACSESYHRGSTTSIDRKGVSGATEPRKRTRGRLSSRSHNVSSFTEDFAGNKVNNLPSAAPIDLERGILQLEHVVLTVTGMTCTGCETKLLKSVTGFPAIRNIKASLLLARAEFDVNHSLASAGDALSHLEKTTGFKFERISSDGEIDLIPDGSVPAFLEQDMPLGVLGMTPIDKGQVRVRFDKSIVGPRDLIEKHLKFPAQLAPPKGDASLEAGRKHVRHVGFMTFLSTILTIPVLVLAWAPIEERPVLYGSISLALATLVQFVVAGPFYPQALKALIFSRVIEIDLLIVLSTSAAYIFSVAAFGYMVHGTPLSTGEFFETSTLLVTLIMVGRFVSTWSRQKAVESISVRSLQASTAELVAEDGSARQIDSRLLQYGDTFKVSPDSRVPTDGTIISGSSEVDESMITGEFQPVEKHVGSRVVAGSINHSGSLVVRLTRVPSESSVTAIANMVDEAKLSKPKLQAIADKVASYFVPVIVVLTIIVFCIWIAVEIRIRKQSGSEAVIQAITYAITVLIVSCPCAIGLAVPMVIVIAGGVSARRGIIFKSSHVIEVACKTTHVILDKTGTVTEGKLNIQSEIYLGNKDVVRSQLLGLLSGVKHPISVATSRHLLSSGVEAAQVTDIKTVPGCGVQGKYQDIVLRAGNPRWLSVSEHPSITPALDQGVTILAVTAGPDLVALFTLTDTLRTSAMPVIQTLQRAGIAVSLVSGDHARAVESTAETLDISSFKAQCSPADKRDYISGLHKTNPEAVTIFIGDGTNDAIALAAATIGLHISPSSGIDNDDNDISLLSQSAADAVLLRPDLSLLLTMLQISGASVRRIYTNFAWAFVYNLAAVLGASGALVKGRIPPQYAGLGELVSVLPVVVVAVGLKWKKFNGDGQKRGTEWFRWGKW